jgi:1,4-alpha-glucan branching enzyme
MTVGCGGALRDRDLWRPAQCRRSPLRQETSMIKYSRKVGSVKVTFALPAEEWAAGCSVVGDFNEWVPGRHQMRRRSNGTRSTSVTLAAGSRVRFRYLGKDGHWFNDPEIVELDGPDCVLAV